MPRDWEVHTRLFDGRVVETVRVRRERRGTLAYATATETTVWRDTTPVVHVDHRGVADNAAAWGALHAAMVELMGGTADTRVSVATLDLGAGDRRYVVVERTADGRVDVLSAPFDDGEEANACARWVDREYDRLDGEWRAEGLRPIDVTGAFRQAVHA